MEISYQSHNLTHNFFYRNIFLELICLHFNRGRNHVPNVQLWGHENTWCHISNTWDFYLKKERGRRRYIIRCQWYSVKSQRCSV